MDDNLAAAVLAVASAQETETTAAAAAASAATPQASENSDIRFSSEAMREVLEMPSSHWADIGAMPVVADALAPFPSELQTRPKGRLDLVTWVAAISGFGCDGPGEGDWQALFSAVCFEPLRLNEVQIATLIAFQKCCDDIAPDISSTNIVKMRIRPAVEGRIQARAPGILLQVQRKYDEYLYSVWPLCLLNQALRDTDPATLIDSPVAGEFEALGGPRGGDRVRSVCDREVEERLKLWERVMLGLLRLDTAKMSPRVRRFNIQRDQYKSRLSSELISAVGLFLLNRQADEPLHFR